MQHEIDLIPASYRQRLRIKRWCEYFATALVVVVVGTVALKHYLDQQNQQLQQRIQSLQTTKTQVRQQQQQYNTLLARERQLQKNLEVLNGLRGGPSVRRVLSAVDRVIDSNVWFLSWEFLRNSEVREAKPEAVSTGYFIVIPAESSGNGKSQTWSSDSQMRIKGQARDHLSLSRFVQLLLQQPEIADVKVIDTTLRRYVSSEVIDFNLNVKLNQASHE